MPKPGKNETREQFIPRCISVVSHEDKSRPRDQIIAICYSIWREHKKNQKKAEEGLTPDIIQKIIEEFDLDIN